MTDNNYDPDTFDWGDGAPGVNLDNFEPDIMEQVVQAALKAHEEKFGWKFLKRSEVKEGAGRLFRVKNYMPKAGKEFFEEQFPGYTFVWDGALGHHDHPVAHLCTELNELEMVEPFSSSGEVYIDLFGNVGRNARYKRNAITLYTLATPKDYLRYPQDSMPANAMLFDMEKMCNKEHVLGKIKNVSVTHALYYLTMDDIGRILHTMPGRRIRALIHRHKDTHGFLNAGEQEYWVDQNMRVTQVNVSTGEKYVHPSLEGLFHQQSATTEHGGVAWTIRAGGGDTFLLDFVGCPNHVCEKYIPLRYVKPETWEEYQYSNISVKTFLHWTWMVANTSQGKVRIEDTELFNSLRRYVAGKQRTPRLRTEVMNHARRMCNKNDIISIHGGGASDIPVASMSDYVEVAFYVDQRHELDAAISFHRDNVNITKALNAYYEHGKLPTDYTVVTGAAALSGKMFSDAAIAVISSVRDSHTLTADEYVAAGLPGDDAARDLITLGDPGGVCGVPW